MTHFEKIQYQHIDKGKRYCCGDDEEEGACEVSSSDIPPSDVEMLTCSDYHGPYDSSPEKESSTPSSTPR